MLLCERKKFIEKKKKVESWVYVVEITGPRKIECCVGCDLTVNYCKVSRGKWVAWAKRLLRTT